MKRFHTRHRLLVFCSTVVAYLVAVWLILAYVPALSAAARTHMTVGRWLWAGFNFFLGFYVAWLVVAMLLGAKSVPYSRWDLSRMREPKSVLGWLALWLFLTGVGFYFANGAVTGSLWR